jgi:hypothetical protein
VGLDLGLCLQGHNKWVGDFSTLVGVYKDDNKFLRDWPPLSEITLAIDHD